MAADPKNGPLRSFALALLPRHGPAGRSALRWLPSPGRGQAPAPGGGLQSLGETLAFGIEVSPRSPRRRGGPTLARKRPRGGRGETGPMVEGPGIGKRPIAGALPIPGVPGPKLLRAL